MSRCSIVLPPSIKRKQFSLFNKLNSLNFLENNIHTQNKYGWISYSIFHNKLFEDINVNTINLVKFKLI